MCFSPYLGVGGGGRGAPKGSRAHNLLMQFSNLGSSKMEISETDFFDTLTIQSDQISYVKHVLAPLYVFFTLFGCWAGGGGGGLPRGLEHNLLMQFSRLSSSKKVVPLPSSRCLAEGNRIFQGAERAEDDLHCDTVVQFVLQSPPPPRAARQNTEPSGDDHAPVTRGRMRAQYPLPHGPRGGTVPS